VKENIKKKRLRSNIFVTTQVHGSGVQRFTVQGWRRTKRLYLTETQRSQSLKK
jgi:hypothetical protein